MSIISGRVRRINSYNENLILFIIITKGKWKHNKLKLRNNYTYEKYFLIEKLWNKRRVVRDRNNEIWEDWKKNLGEWKKMREMIDNEKEVKGKREKENDT